MYLVSKLHDEELVFYVYFTIIEVIQWRGDNEKFYKMKHGTVAEFCPQQDSNLRCDLKSEALIACPHLK